MCGRVKEAKPINIIFSIDFSRNSKFIKKIKPINKIKKVIKVKNNDCLRNNFNYLEKDICIFSFKGILAYYYYVFYKKNFTPNLYYSQIKDYIEIHEEIGLNNPVFYYDPQTFLWFINFDKIGKKTNKAPIEEVKKTVNNILDCLEVDRFFNSFTTNKLKQEFESCLISFNKQRNDKINIPLLACNEDIEESFATRFCLSKFEII